MQNVSAASSAVVTDGLWRKSLSAIRSLGKAGFRVTVMGASVFTTGFWSRFASERVHAPTATHDPEHFGRALLKTVKKAHARGAKPVLFPMEDATLNWISDHRDELSEDSVFLIPSRESLAIAQDKGKTLSHASKIGIVCPKTFEPKSAEEFAELALSKSTGRFVVKPRSGSGSHGIIYGESRSREEWISHWKTHGPLVIQERVSARGRGLGVSCLFDQTGECIVAFAHERLKEYPVTGGPSTDRRSIHAPDLVAETVRLLKSLSWRGIAMVEWKRDPDDGDKPKLMEINPRFWGSLELAIRAGVDFPTLYARAVLGEPLARINDYPADVRCRWLVPGDILRFMSERKPARESFFQFLKGLPSLAEEWDPRDLRGFFATLICTAALALNPRYWKYVRRG